MFFIFHLILALVVFIQSVGTVRHAIADNDSHLGLLASLEALAAALFVVPKTIRIGGAILLMIFAIAIAIHGIRDGLNLIVYAAGVVLVMTKGDTFGKMGGQKSEKGISLQLFELPLT